MFSSTQALFVQQSQYSCTLGRFDAGDLFSGAKEVLGLTCITFNRGTAAAVLGYWGGGGQGLARAELIVVAEPGFGQPIWLERCREGLCDS